MGSNGEKNQRKEVGLWEEMDRVRISGEGGNEESNKTEKLRLWEEMNIMTVVGE